MNFNINETGYATLNEAGKMVTIHQLLAIRNGAPPRAIFGGRGGAGRSMEAHHRVGHGLVNIPEYVTPLPVDEHRQLHAHGEYVTDEHGFPVLRKADRTLNDH